MGFLTNKINENSIYSTNPYLGLSQKGNANIDGVDVVVHPDEVCRLYVENWVDPAKDVIPHGFIPDSAVRDLIQNPNNSVISEANPYIKFMIDTVQSSFNETYLPIKNLSHGFSTYVFGQEPSTINFGGILVRTNLDNWSELLLSLYHYFLRASKLAELSLILGKDYQIVIRYQGKIFKGSLVSFGKVTTASNETAVRFNFQLLVKSITFEWTPTVSFPSKSLYNSASENGTKVNDQGEPTTINFKTNIVAQDVNSLKLNVALNKQS